MYLRIFQRRTGFKTQVTPWQACVLVHTKSWKLRHAANGTQNACRCLFGNSSDVDQTLVKGYIGFCHRSTEYDKRQPDQGYHMNIGKPYRNYMLKTQNTVRILPCLPKGVQLSACPMSSGSVTCHQIYDSQDILSKTKLVINMQAHLSSGTRDGWAEDNQYGCSLHISKLPFACVANTTQFSRINYSNKLCFGPTPLHSKHFLTVGHTP